MQKDVPKTVVNGGISLVQNTGETGQKSGLETRENTDCLTETTRIKHSDKYLIINLVFLISLRRRYRTKNGLAVSLCK